MIKSPLCMLLSAAGRTELCSPSFFDPFHIHLSVLAAMPACRLPSSRWRKLLLCTDSFLHYPRDNLTFHPSIHLATIFLVLDAHMRCSTLTWGCGTQSTWGGLEDYFSKCMWHKEYLACSRGPIVLFALLIPVSSNFHSFIAKWDKSLGTSGRSVGCYPLLHPVGYGTRLRMKGTEHEAIRKAPFTCNFVKKNICTC